VNARNAMPRHDVSSRRAAQHERNGDRLIGVYAIGATCSASEVCAASAIEESF
jgi:hypothetical protein